MEKNSTYYKYCMVPFCESTTIKTPSKIFIRLPDDRNRRKRWFEACRRDIKSISKNTQALHVCEDHFNLEDDMENYVKFKLIGGRKKMKVDVVPHIFDWQLDQKQEDSLSQSPEVGARKRVKRKLDKEAVASCSNLIPSPHPEEPEIIIKVSKYEYMTDNQKKDASTQTCIINQSKGVQCKLDYSVSPARTILENKDKGTSPKRPSIQTSDSFNSEVSSETVDRDINYYSESDTHVMKDFTFVKIEDT